MFALSRDVSTLACRACLAHHQKSYSVTDDSCKSIQLNPAILQTKIDATYHLLALRISDSHFYCQGGEHQQVALLHQPVHPIFQYITCQNLDVNSVAVLISPHKRLMMLPATSISPACCLPCPKTSSFVDSLHHSFHIFIAASINASASAFSHEVCVPSQSK